MLSKNFKQNSRCQLIIKLMLCHLALVILASCNTSKTYTLKKEGNEILLNGIVSKEVLMNKKLYPWCAWGISVYKPNPILIDSIKPLCKNVKVLMFGGTWCSDTQLELPRFYKVAELCGMQQNQMELIMVDRAKKTKNINTDILGVKNIPAFIFYRQNHEIGRIIEKPDSCTELHILRILSLN